MPRAAPDTLKQSDALSDGLHRSRFLSFSLTPSVCVCVCMRVRTCVSVCLAPLDLFLSPFEVLIT